MRRIEISKAICHHLCAINQGIHGNDVYYPELFEVSQDVPVGLPFIRDDPCRHGLAGKGIGCKAGKTLSSSLLRFAPVRLYKQLICLA